MVLHGDDILDAAYADEKPDGIMDNIEDTLW